MSRRSPASDEDIQRFAARARDEAQRYGDDPWIFVRELLQNARDAGATTIDVTTAQEGGIERITCRDNGSGMTFDHARRYLFRLYATSKERDRRAAGRFGVGFWAVLRFDPDRIVVRSWPRQRPALSWEIELDGTLARANQRALEDARHSGTEVVVERVGTDPVALERHVLRAAWRDGRFLTCRDHPRQPLVLRVNGRRLAAPFDLLPPRTRFQHGRAQGVVALGQSPRVELFSRGLRVRQALALDDLLNPFERRTSRSSDDGRSAEGAAPRALVESPDLNLDLARSDAHDDRALRRVVGRAQRELARLVARQIDVLRPRSRMRRLMDAVSAGGAWQGLAILALAAAVSLATVTALRRLGPSSSSVDQEAQRPRAGLQPLRDLAGTYRGPDVDVPDARSSTLAITYTPAAARPYFAILTVPWDELLTATGTRESAPSLASLAAPYEGPEAGGSDAGVVRVRVAVAAPPEEVRLPVPTGHRVVPGSVRLDDRPLSVHASVLDEPLVELPALPTPGVITYLTAPARPHLPSSASVHVPDALADPVNRLRQLPVDERPSAALDWVRGVIRYAADAETARRHAMLAAGGVPPVVRALRVGAGDCDVVNGLLAVVLAGAGVEARLVVGVMGVDGHVGGLHAWVEYRQGGPWRVLDATTVVPTAGGSLAPDASARAATGAAGLTSPPSPPITGDLDAVGAGPWRIAIAIATAGIAVFLAIIITTARRGMTRQTRLDPGQDLAALLRGALEHPETFASAPAIFERRLLPIQGGGRLSLGDAWRLAARRKLHGATRLASLARRAASGGHRVLDTRDEDAQLVAASLGATDLDAWQALTDRSTASPLLAAVARTLSDSGWRLDLRSAVLCTNEVTAEAASLDLPGTWRTRPVTTAVLCGPPWLPDLERLFTRRPIEATLRCAERVADALGIPNGRRRRWRRRLSREALHEDLA
jgi:transglutaminase-like putative cysteine protease